MDDLDGDVEQTLFMVRECFVYKIPPRQTIGGYRAADWNVNEWMWSGRAKVVAKGMQCNIILEDNATGQLFASCALNPEGTSVEPVVDSSRYFVLKIEDGTGRHAFIGLGFKDRSEAYDFNVSLQDHQKYVQRAKAGPTSEAPQGPSVDYSLQAGQTIHINLKNKDGKKAVVRTSSPTRDSTGATCGKPVPTLAPPPSRGSVAPILPPPPSSATRAKSLSSPSSRTPPSYGSGFSSQLGTPPKKASDDLEDLLGLSSAPAAKAAAAPSVPSSSSNFANLSLDDLLK